MSNPSLTIWWHLVRRKVLVFSRQWKDQLINSMIVSLFSSLNYGLFLPVFGMSASYSMPLFIGAVVTTVLIVGYNYGVMITQDLQSENVLRYHLSLPVHPLVVVSAYVVGAALQIFMVAIPSLVLGLALLGGVSVASISWFYVGALTLLTLSFGGLFFFLAGIIFSFEWYMGDAWPRLFAPLYVFSAFHYTWYALKKFSPVLSSLVLFSPFTYSTEGMRAALLGCDKPFIHPGLCIAALTFIISVLVYATSLALKKKLAIVSFHEKKELI